MAKKRKKKRIRPLALCVFRRQSMIFVARGYDAHKDETFYRPIGGGIKFGERGCDALVREVREELEAEVTNVTLLGALENIFTYENAPGHEITLIYDGRFSDPALNADDVCVQGREGADILYEACWKPLDFFGCADAPPLYPEGLLELLEHAGKRVCRSQSQISATGKTTLATPGEA